MNFAKKSARIRRSCLVSAVLLSAVFYSVLVAWAETTQLFGLTDFAVLYVLGVCAVGFTIGWPWALFLAASCAVLDGAWQHDQPSSWLAIPTIWTFCSDFLLFSGLGWLADRMRILREERAELAREIAEKQVALRKLQSTQEQLALILKNSPVCLYAAEVKPPYRLTYVSDHVEKLFGYTPEELLDDKNPWIGRVHPEDRQEIETFLAGFFSHSEESCVYRFRKRDGDYVWVLDSTKLVRNDEGEPISAMGFICDINERKTAVQNLQLQRDLALALSLQPDLESGLKTLLHTASQMDGVDCGAIYLVDETTSDLRLVVHHGLNPDFVELVRTAPRGSQAVKLVLDRRSVFTRFDKLELDPRVYACENLLSVANVPLQYQGQLLGCLTAASHTHPEIPTQTRRSLETLATQAAGAIFRIRTQEALRRSENRLQTIIDSTPVILLAADSNGRITFEDGQALRALRIDPATHVGACLWEFCNPPNPIHTYVERVLQGEEFNAFIEINENPFDCWFSPERDADHSIIGFFAVAINLSERQRLESQILEISDREQARIGQDIHDGLCQQLVSLAFDANALQGHIAKTSRPAATLANRLCLLLDDSITHARQLARGLFPIRLESEGLPSALEELAGGITERFHVRCQFSPAGDTPSISQVQATHLYRIAQEAVNNAVKHARPRNLHISLAVRSSTIELTVQDDGVGIDSALIHTGMGLSIMNYRAHSLGGSITLSSKNGQGTTVSCCVPLGSKQGHTLHA